MISLDEITRGFRFSFEDKLTKAVNCYRVTEVHTGTFRASNIGDNVSRVFSNDPTTLRHCNRITGSPDYDIDLLPVLGNRVRVVMKDGGERNGVVTGIEAEVFDFFGKKRTKVTSIIFDNDPSDFIPFALVTSLEFLD